MYKKIFILNTAGFYNHLLAFAQTMQDEGFLYDNIEDKLVVLNQPAEMLEHL